MWILMNGEKIMKNLIFDIDGTLWNTTAVVAGAWNQAVSESGVKELSDLFVTDKMLQKEFGKPMDVIADDLFGEIDSKVKADLLAKCCVYEHEAILNNTEDLTYKGMRETLRELSKEKNLYIVSNCQDGYIELVMEKNGLSDIIKDYECFGHTGLQKGENISLLVSRNGLSKEDTVYIGDTYGDFLATKEAGLQFVFAEYGFGEVKEADFVIKDIRDLLNM